MLQVIYVVTRLHIFAEYPKTKNAMVGGSYILAIVDMTVSKMLIHAPSAA